MSLMPWRYGKLEVNLHSKFVAHNFTLEFPDMGDMSIISPLGFVPFTETHTADGTMPVS